MFKVVNQSKKVSRKNLADKNLNIPYHDRLNKSEDVNAYTPFFQADCGNGYSRFEYYKDNI